MSTPLRVLILEDRTTDAELVLHELRRAGYEPEWRRVDTGPDYLANLTPDLDIILADYTLPQFNALRALHGLQDQCLDIPFIIVTATVSEEVVVECMKQGATDYLLKDRLGRLGSAIESALQQKRLRNEKGRIDNALRESEERFRRLAENAQDIIYRYELAPRRCFTYVSPAAMLITGYTPAEYYDDPDLMVKTVYPDDQPLIQTMVQTGKPLETPLTQRWIRKDGTIIWVEQHCVPIYDSSGKLAAVEGIARDVTKRKQAEEENVRLYQAQREAFHRLQESQAQLVQAEKMTALGRLVASIIHEINNPLQAMQNSVELATEELEGDLRREKLAFYLGMALTEIERLATIMHRLRDFCRSLRQEMCPTDVHAVLHSVLELTARQLQHSHVSVECDWAPDLPAIQANPDYLKQVFLNLVLNAIDAMAPTGEDSQPGGRLRVRTLHDKMQTGDGRERPAVRIELCDTGKGIPQEILPNIFEPFVTTKATGIGLGLSISYRIIETHGGQITVASKTGGGTTFTIWLPVSESQA